MKSPTIEKIDMIAEVLDVHPVTLIALAYAMQSKDPDSMLDQIQNEVKLALNSA